MFLIPEVLYSVFNRTYNHYSINASYYYILTFLIFALYSKAMQKSNADQIKIDSKKSIQNKERESSPLIFFGKNANEKLTIKPKNLIYISSMGHYVNIIYLNVETGKIEKYNLRNSLKNFEKELKDAPNYIRCHNQYLINLDYATALIGNSHKANIKLKLVSEKIPIGKNKYNFIKAHFTTKKKF